MPMNLHGPSTTSTSPGAAPAAPAGGKPSSKAACCLGYVNTLLMLLFLPL